MALTDQNREYLYLALGLRAEGGARYRVRWNFYTTWSITQSTIAWSHAQAKALVDARVGYAPDAGVSQLSAAAITELGTLLDTYRGTLTSSFQMKGEVQLSDAQENKLALDAIYRMVGIEIEEAPTDIVRPMGGGGHAGRLDY